MPSFNEHFAQAKHNLKFIEELNQKVDHYWDWHVTACFYVAVHLINAHLAKSLNIHYRKHFEVFGEINPFNQDARAKLSPDEYNSFRTLSNLSRRSRYLISDNVKLRNEVAHFTQKKHFDKAIRNLDVLIEFMQRNYKASFPIIYIKSGIPEPDKVKYFK